MKIKKLPLIICLAAPLLAGGGAALLTKEGMQRFENAVRPPLVPPGWVFPIVWAILFLLMGLASYLAYASGGAKRQICSALLLYAVQLGFNFAWTVLFFNYALYLAAAAWLAALLALVLTTTLRFYALNKAAGRLMLPYAAWTLFALYLNAGVYMLN